MHRQLLLVATVGALSTGVAFAERHIVTATSYEWIYRDLRSGEGEANAVRIFARAGDEIEFRQSSGRHGVFFYRTPMGVSELGVAIDVMRDFAPAGEGDVFETDPLSSGLFPRENVTTPERTGTARIVTIRLGSNFREPLYFGDRVRSVRNGNIMFGLIIPAGDAVSPTVEPATLSPDVSLRNSMRAPRYEWQRGVLGNLDKGRDDRVFVYTPDGLFTAAKDEPLSIDRGDAKTDTWFAQTRRFSPERSRWYYATPVDVDVDNDLDLLVCASVNDETTGWWILTSNVSQSEGPESTTQFEDQVYVAEGPRLEEADRTFAIAAELNNDGLPDLVLYNGDVDGRLNIHLSRRTYRVPEERFRAIEPVVPGVEDANFVYPLDADFDGWMDLLLAAGDGTAMILFNRAPGRFGMDASETLPAALRQIESIGLYDIDRDLRSDIVIDDAQDGRIIILNNGERRFSLSQ